jgi:hypothetical protein
MKRTFLEVLTVGLLVAFFGMAILAGCAGGPSQAEQEAQRLEQEAHAKAVIERREKREAEEKAKKEAEAEERRKQEEEVRATVTKITSQFANYHGRKEYGETFANLSNPYYFEENDGYYLESVIPLNWIDNKTVQVNCSYFQMFVGTKESTFFYIDIGDFKPSDISKNTVLGSDLGQVMIVKPDGVMTMRPKFKLIHIVVKSGMYDATATFGNTSIKN